MKVTPKKRLGQHFLEDESIAEMTANSLVSGNSEVLEIGPGMGVLTKYLLKNPKINLKVVEIDEESVDFLRKNFPNLHDSIIGKDFLTLDLASMYGENFTIIGNFPYNISSQILFKLLENKERATELVGMFQKEVAERVCSAPGKKQYGIISVLLQAFYDVEYLFTIDETAFFPPPKVKSAVIRLTRNFEKKLACDEKSFKMVVKTAFNQRRKTLRNSLKALTFDDGFLTDSVFNLRPEQLSVAEFERITQHVQVDGAAEKKS